MENKDSEEKLNVITLGNSAVGKTSYILKYTENSFQQVYLSTIGIDFKVKHFTLPKNKTYKLYFYDTTGQERFKSIAVNTVKNADGILLMYDITNKTSFDSIVGWMQSIIKIKGEQFPTILIGNKLDLENSDAEGEGRQVEKEEGEELAKKYNISFYETSNKDGINIQEPIVDLVNQILEYKKRIKEKKSENIRLNKKDLEKRNDDANSCSC